MEDRQSLNPGRVKITLDDGTVMFGTIERDDSPSVVGTPLNKNTLFNSNNSERFAVNLPSEAFELISRDVEVTVPTSGWSTAVDSEGYYTNRVNVSGMSSKHNPVFALKPSNATDVITEESDFSEIKKMTTFDGYVIFKSCSFIANDLKVIIKGA